MTPAPAVDSLEHMKLGQALVAWNRRDGAENASIKIGQEYVVAAAIGVLTRPPGGSERLRELAAKWRARAIVRGDYAGATEECADELEAALASPQGTEQRQEGLEPIAWADPASMQGYTLGAYGDFAAGDRSDVRSVPLYTTPRPEPAAPQADQQGEECPHDWYPYVQALYKTYGPVTMDDKGIAGYETLGRMCAECGKIEAPAKPSDQQGADEVEQAADTGYTDPEPAATQGDALPERLLLAATNWPTVYESDRMIAALLRQAATALSSPTGVQAAQVEEYQPIERDESMNREYIPMPGGWEVQTKGSGSTFRIAGPDKDDRLPIEPRPYLHATLTKMAREVNAAWKVIAQRGSATRGGEVSDADQ